MDPLRRTPIAEKLALARRLRRECTPAERHAWTLLRNRRLLGLKFRRQHVLRGFIVDFYCPQLELVLEVEGSAHEGPAQAAYDAARTALLRSAGYRVITIANRDVSRDRLEELVRASLQVPSPLRSSPPGPLSLRERGDEGPASRVPKRSAPSPHGGEGDRG